MMRDWTTTGGMPPEKEGGPKVKQSTRSTAAAFGAVAVLVLALGCLQDRTGAGSGGLPTMTGPGSDSLGVPPPRRAAADTIDCSLFPQWECPIVPASGGIGVSGEDPCPGLGEHWEDDGGFAGEGGCVCDDNLERDEYGNCEWPGITPVVGGPGIIPGQGGVGLRPGRDRDDDDDDDDPEEDEALDLDVTLTCSPGTVTRGQSVTCTAIMSNIEGKRRPYGWRFIPDRDAKVYDDGGPGLGLNNVRHTGGVGDTTWFGVVATPGKVTVRVEDSTQFAVVSVGIVVNPRGGWTTPVTLAGEGPAFDQAIIKGDTAVVGYNADASSGEYERGHVLQGTGDLASAEILGGPNRGYWYTTDHGYHVTRRYHLNSRITESGPREIPDAAGVNAWTWLSGQGHHPADTRDGVTAHETEGNSDRNAPGHQRQFAEAVALGTRACAEAAGLAERIVTESGGAMEGWADLIKDNAERTFWLASSHHIVWNNYALVPFAVRDTAVFDDDTIPAPDTFFVSMGRDRQGPRPNRPPREANCDWTSF